MAVPPRPRLFSSEPRTDSSPARHNERYFAFLDRVDRPWFDAVRELLEAWLDDTPSPFAERVARNFRTTSDRQFYGAFWELYQFTLWNRLGYTTEPEPPIGGTGRYADILVSRDGRAAIVEACVSFEDTADSAESRRLGEAYNALDRIDSPNFFLWIDVQQGDGPMPTMAPVRRELESWLQTLDPDVVAAALGDGSSEESLPTRDLNAGSWRLRFRAIPKSGGSRGQPGIRPLGVFGTGGARVLTTVSRLRDALVAKADQTRGAEGPVVIALDALGTFVDDRDVYASLFGDDAIQIRTWSNGQIDTARVREMTGLWTEGRLGRRAHVSAILVSENLGPQNISRVEPVLWLNPWAIHALQLDLPFKRVVIDVAQGKRVDHAAQARAFEILGIEPDWPGPGSPYDDEEGVV